MKKRRWFFFAAGLFGAALLTFGALKVHTLLNSAFPADSDEVFLEGNTYDEMVKVPLPETITAASFGASADKNDSKAPENTEDTREDFSQKPTDEQNADITAAETADPSVPQETTAENTENTVTQPTASETAPAIVPTPPEPTETAPPATVEQPTTVSSGIGIPFSFIKYNIPEHASKEYYTYLLNQGFAPIKSEQEFAVFAKNALDGRGEQHSEIHYLITPQGLLDAVANQQNLLTAAAAEAPTPRNIRLRETYLYDVCGMDYERYYAEGVGLFMLHKTQEDVTIQDTKYSLYAVYFYSYTTASETALLKEKAAELALQFTGSDYEKIRAAHDYLAAGTVYDLEAPNAHTAYGALIDKRCVCEGYAKAMKLLLDAMNIPCEIVLNETHAWNEVYLDGQWYFVDVTNDSVNRRNGQDCTCFFLLGQDVLYASGDVTVDGHVLKQQDNILFYRYQDQTNTGKNTLAAETYQAAERMKH